jgi:hypothetical protein
MDNKPTLWQRLVNVLPEPIFRYLLARALEAEVMSQRRSRKNGRSKKAG